MKRTCGISLAGFLLAATGFGAQLDRWQVVSAPGTFLTLLDLAYGGGTFVAVGQTHDHEYMAGEIFTSVDGARWTRRNSGVPDALHGVAYGPNGFVIAGAGYDGVTPIDIILSSPDAMTWTRRLAGLTNYLLDISYGNDSFLAVGSRGTVITSGDGVVWADRNARSSDILLGVAGAGGRFVAVGSSPNGGTILTSSDGSQWARRGIGNSQLRDVAYGNGQFIVVGENDTILRSSDLATWTASPSGVNGHLFAIIFHEGLFIAVGYPGTVMSSVDGTNWRVHRTGTELLYGIAFGNGRYVAVDYMGQILRTQPANTPPIPVVDVSPTPEFFFGAPYVVISPNGINATVNFSGARSYDEEEDALSFLWLENQADGSIIEVARTEQTTLVLPVGEHDFTLRVSDGVEEAGVDFQVQVITVSDALETVLTLVEESVLSKQDKHVLTVLLEKMQSTFENGQTGSGLERLGRLERQIEARARDADPNAAELLIAAIRAIRAVFEASPASGL